MEMIYTLPFFIRNDEKYCSYDLDLAHRCFSSLQLSDDVLVVLYNQGCLTNDEIEDFLSNYRIRTIMIGNGENIGIAKARQLCFEYIWENYSEVPFICEIHLDMVFTKNWHIPLVDFLKVSDEPMVSPGIITSNGELHPINKGVSIGKVPMEYKKLEILLNRVIKEEIWEGFVHPVIHKSNILQEIGGYDYHFLKGKQGYEDDSILLGYLYYMGTRTNWKPKAYLKSYVYHASMAQRMTLQGKEEDFNLNLRGLFYQYGGYGFKFLSKLHKNDDSFQKLFENVLKQL
ncbi:hypothetical protein [Maledivibacter halophilus]|uniref:Glycosyltransferase, GT2 family n=1 Tax=Maledivibacter halophilus TaxID=36842 RepID=A0A1T5M7I3_9FIRM|nr:hypothetical protein [Maledivibacter halophilus]SKC84200.1 hypothetical protein SAMN02194393_04032 [Maledivibacter halophilus]